MNIKNFLLSLVLLLSLLAPAQAQLVQNPLVIPSTSFVAGQCIQATGPNSIATTGSACGSGSGSGNVSGPTSATVNDLAIYSSAAGTAIADPGIQYTNLGLLNTSQTYTGTKTFSVPAFFSGLTSTAAPINLSGASSTLRGVFYQTNGVNRWSEGASVDAEDGGNTGSSWVLQAYGDSGSVGVTAMTASRITGQVYFGVRPAFGSSTPWDSGNLPNPAQTTAANAFTSATPNTFAVRPLFNGNLPWDAGNFNPANYLPLSGGVLAGPLSGTSANFSGSIAGAGAYLNNGITGSSLASNFTVTNASGSNAINLYPSLAGASYNGLVSSGDAAVIAGTSAGNGNLVLAPWMSSASDGIRLTPTGNTISGPTTISGAATVNGASTLNGSSTWANDTQINVPEISLVGTPSGVVNGIYSSGTAILYPLGTQTTVNAPAGGSLYLTIGGNGGVGAYIDSSGIFHEPEGINAGSLTVTGAASLGSGSNAVTQAAGDSSTFIATDAFVANAVATAQANPIVTGMATITGTLKVTGVAQFANPIQAPAIQSVGPLPTTALGSGAGTGATVTNVAGTSMNGTIEITTGTSSVPGGMIASLTTANSGRTTPTYCMVSDVSTYTQVLPAVNQTLTGGTLTMTLTLVNNETLAPQSDYQWSWYCP